MSTNQALELKLAEAYGRALAIHEKLVGTIEKIKEDDLKKLPKAKQALTNLKIDFKLAAEGLDQLREETDLVLESGVLTNKDITNMDQSLQKLLTLKIKLEADDITSDQYDKWLGDLVSVKSSLSQRHQVKRVDSERQASVSSLTEQLKKKDEQITELLKEKQERDSQISELTKELVSATRPIGDKI